MSDELKACPFCGSDSQILLVVSKNTFLPRYRVGCKNFNCQTMGLKKITEKEAIKAWNNRPEPPEEK